MGEKKESLEHGNHGTLKICMALYFCTSVEKFQWFLYSLSLFIVHSLHIVLIVRHMMLNGISR